MLLEKAANEKVAEARSGGHVLDWEFVSIRRSPQDSPYMLTYPAVV